MHSFSSLVTKHSCFLSLVMKNCVLLSLVTNLFYSISLRIGPFGVLLENRIFSGFFSGFFPGFFRIFFWILNSSKGVFKGRVLCKKVSFDTHIYNSVWRFSSRAKFIFFGLHSVFNFIPRFTSLRSVPLGIKFSASFWPKKWISPSEKKSSYLVAHGVSKSYISIGNSKHMTSA